MKYAVIKNSGKQYRVSEGDKLLIDTTKEAGSNITFTEVLLAVDGEQRIIGTPLVDGAIVTAKIEKNLKGPKVVTAKYKAKSRYRKKTGYRHQFTQVVIEKIEMKKTGLSEKPLTRVKK